MLVITFHQRQLIILQILTFKQTELCSNVMVSLQIWHFGRPVFLIIQPWVPIRSQNKMTCCFVYIGISRHNSTLCLISQFYLCYFPFILLQMENFVLYLIFKLLKVTSDTDWMLLLFLWLGRLLPSYPFIQYVEEPI